MIRRINILANRVRFPLLIFGLTIGAIIGYLAYTITQLSGLALFITIGGVIGVVTALVLAATTRPRDDVILSEVRLTIPQFSELTFVVNAEYRRVAWKLFVETITRVSTQPIGDTEGHLRETLDSLYGLFAATRDLIKAMDPSKKTSGMTVEMFAISMLNDGLRPFLSKWHPLLTAFEKDHPGQSDRAWGLAIGFRKELRELQTKLLYFTHGFGELAEVPHLDKLIGTLDGDKPA